MENDGMKDLIEIVEDCGDSCSGTWAIPSEKKSGVMCWRTHYGKSKTWVPWPETLVCRDCGITFMRAQIQKQWLSPIRYSHSDGTFNCGGHGIDSSD